MPVAGLSSCPSRMRTCISTWRPFEGVNIQEESPNIDWLSAGAVDAAAGTSWRGEDNAA